MKKIKIIFVILMIFSFVFVDKFAYAYEVIVNNQNVQIEEENTSKDTGQINANDKTEDEIEDKNETNNSEEEDETEQTDKNEIDNTEEEDETEQTDKNEETEIQEEVEKTPKQEILKIEEQSVKQEEINEKIEEGLYVIETAVNSNAAVEVRDASMYSGGNVQIYRKNNAKCQTVYIKNVGDGYYTIKFEHSGMYLDVANGKNTNGTNVWQCKYNGSDAQKWKIQKLEDGYYTLISKCSNTYLTVTGGGTANCTNIEINSIKKDNSQKFKLNKIEPIKGQKILAEGIYEIETGVNSNTVVEVRDASEYSGGNVQIFRKNNAKCQKVLIQYGNDGYYTIKFQHSGMYLDVADGETTNGTNVWQCRYNGSDAQKWVIQEADDGYYKIISKASNTYLTVTGGGTANCTNIEINSDKKNASQKFKFNLVQTIKGERTIEDGIYEIELGLTNQKVVEVRDASEYSGGNVQIFARNNAKCQKVLIQYGNDGYYTIKFQHSGMYLDVANGETANGTNVWQCRYNGADAQKWVIQEADDGYYKIISKASNTYLTVTGGGTANCTNIEINSDKKNASQKFKFNLVQTIKGERTIEDGIYEIELGLTNQKVVEVRDASEYSGGNVQIFARNNAKCQKVLIQYGNDGYYTIKFQHSGMYLDVANGETANGTNAWQCRYNGSDAQKWIIKEADDGYYKIISKVSNTYLTVAGGKTANCTNIEINENKQDKSQLFKFNEIKDLKGIDVSVHQGIIDWEKVKKSDIDFAIIRCGYGKNSEDQDDKMYMRNIQECERLKIPYGVYLYSYALNAESALSEAEHVLRLIKGYSPQMGIWFDMEDADGYKIRNGMPSNETLVNICITFCEKIKENGYRVGIYANLEWLDNQLNDSKLDKYDKWVAQWNSVCNYTKKYVMWQYTDSGRVDGIEGPVDMNKYYM